MSSNGEVHLREAVALAEGQFGRNDYEVAVNVGNLAAALQRRGEYQEAWELYERELAIKSAVLGRHHLDLAPTLLNLASLHAAAGRHADAAACNRRANALLAASNGAPESA